MMKTKKLFIGLSIFSIIYLISCAKSEEESVQDENSIGIKFYDKEYIRTAPLEEQVNYRIFHLKQLLNEVLSSKIEFKSLFLQKTGKDEGFGRVFFRDLIYSNVIDSKDGSVDENIQYSLGALDGLSEVDLTPYIEKIKEGDDETPLFILQTYDVETEKEIVIGFEINSNQELLQIEGEIMESDIFGSETGMMVETSTVYKIGETDECGNWYKSASCGSTGTTGDTGGTSGTNVTTASKLVQIKSMIIKDKKESWLEKADIWIGARRLQVVDGEVVEIIPVPKQTGYSPGDGINVDYPYEMAKFSQKDVKNRVRKTLDYSVVGQRASSFSDFLIYVIHEHDSWPAPVKSTAFKPNGYYVGGLPLSYSIKWRSYNDKYSAKVFDISNDNPTSEPLPFGINVNNDVIEYDFKDYN